jgi:signal transduction histidine kinase
MPFLSHYGMDDQEQKKRQAFLGITEQDAENVRSLRAIFVHHAKQFAERFYQHLLAHAHTAALLKDPEQLERLKTLQAEYFARLLEGVFDEAYFEGRLRVGHAHQRVGLEPVWYLGAYNQYIQLTFPLFAQAFGENLPQALPTLLSLVKVIFLDIGLALDTYFQDAVEKIRRRNQELQQALGLYWQAQRREEQMRKLVSHEVRGGLAAVITSLEDLVDASGGSLDSATAEELDSITRRCWSLSNLLREMLTTTEVAGPTWVDTAQIFENLAARFGLYAEGRAIHLHLPEHTPRVWADLLQLREVFANLVSNAVRYLDKEPGRVDISCRPDGEFYLFCVADNGPGIPPQIRERLFEPFVRGPASPSPSRPGVTTDKVRSLHRSLSVAALRGEGRGEGRTGPEGTGLGLYFVRTAIEQGGGRIWVESTPDQGSRFWFTVRRVPPEAPEPSRRASSSE